MTFVTLLTIEYYFARYIYMCNFKYIDKRFMSAFAFFYVYITESKGTDVLIVS